MSISQPRNDWLLLLCSFYGYVDQSFRLKSCETVFAFMVYPCEVKTNECNLLKNNGHFFVCLATRKLLQSLRCFSHYSVKQFLLNMPFINRNYKVTCEICGTDTTRKFLRVSKREVQVEHFSMPNVPTSKHVVTLISTFVLQKSIAYPSQRKFTSVNFVIKFLLVFIPCDYIDRRCTTRKVYRRPKMWMSHSC